MLKKSDFFYDLPESHIAKTPIKHREQAKLLVIDRAKKTVQHRKFFELPEILPRNTLIVRNNAKVSKARLTGNFETGAAFELFLLRSLSKRSGHFLVKPGKKFPLGHKVDLPIDERTYAVQVRKVHEDGSRDLFFLDLDTTLEQFFEKHASIPLPPYMKNTDPEAVEKNYQTTYAKVTGSVAAPTAGLHFTKEIDRALQEQGIESEEITLHVGAGTFLPVKADNIEDHTMHKEFFSLGKKTWEKLIKHKEKGQPILTVGTTTTRTLEHVANHPPEEEKVIEGSTDIFIYPPYTFKMADMLLTNFHLPESTLLMMISAFIGDREWTLDIYKEAIANNYRFYSFGDAMLII